MPKFFRVSLGKNAQYLEDALEHGYIGTGWMAETDLTGTFPENWRDFNKVYVPQLVASGECGSNVAAGLASGMTWTVASFINEGDLVLVPTGSSKYKVARVIGPYIYVPGQPLPHRRLVEWLNVELDRESFSEDLKRPTKSAGTVVTLGENPELEGLIGGLPEQEIVVTVSDVESPMSFVLEKHLEDFLVSNWAGTELGRSYDILTDEGVVVGQQYQTDTGPIDILALSKDGTELLVVELKRGRVSDVVVGQILRYMGYVRELDPNKTVRGVIVGTDDDQRFRRAISMVENIDFYRYEVDFKLFKS